MAAANVPLPVSKALPRINSGTVTVGGSGSVEETRKRPPPKHLTLNQTQQKRHRPLEGRGGGGTGALQQAQLSPPNSWPLRSFFRLCFLPLYLSLLTRPWWRGGRTRCGRGRRTGEGGSGRSLREPEDRRFRRNRRNEYVMAANFSKCGVYNANVGNLPAHLCWWPGMWWSAW